MTPCISDADVHLCSNIRISSRFESWILLTTYCRILWLSYWNAYQRSSCLGTFRNRLDHGPSSWERFFFLRLESFSHAQHFPFFPFLYGSRKHIVQSLRFTTQNLPRTCFQVNQRVCHVAWAVFPSTRNFCRQFWMRAFSWDPPQHATPLVRARVAISQIVRHCFRVHLCSRSMCIVRLV